MEEEEEEEEMDYTEIIRDTGPVASMGTSCATSLAPSDDEEQVSCRVLRILRCPSLLIKRSSLQSPAGYLQKLLKIKWMGGNQPI
jgi:hypothetical protein